VIEPGSFKARRDPGREVSRIAPLSCLSGEMTERSVSEAWVEALLRGVRRPLSSMASAMLGVGTEAKDVVQELRFLRKTAVATPVEARKYPSAVTTPAEVFAS
jgi:hypothetical protein